MDKLGLDSLKRSDKEREFILLLRREKASRGLQDLYFFGKHILGYKDMEEEPHREMCDFVQQWPEGIFSKLDIEPRNSFKSSVITITYSIQQIVKDPNIRILINNQDVTIAKKFLSEIKGHFESNDEFIACYGDFVGPTWTNDQIIVKQRTRHRKEPTIMCGGIESPKTGMHVDLMFNDDLLDEHNTNTPEQIEKAIEFWKHQQQLPEVKPQGKQITIGTIWTVDDLYNEIIEMEKGRRKTTGKKGLLVRKRGAHNPDGSLYFPERLTEDFLAAKKIEVGSRVYACQYENNPVDEDAVLFKSKWMKFYGYYPPKNLVITAVLDPAISEKDSACDSAFTFVGTDEDGYMYILGAEFLKAEPNEVVDRIFTLNDMFNPVIFGIESVAFSKTYKFWVWERMRQTGKSVNVQELKPDTTITKDMRIKALVPFFESGSILWPGKSEKDFDENMRKLWDQITMYPMTKLIDGPDSLAYHLNIYTPASVKRQAPIRKDGITLNDIHKERRARLSKVGKGKIILGKHSVAPAQASLFERVNNG